MIWTDEQKAYLNLLEIPIWVSQEAARQIAESSSNTTTEIATDTIPEKTETIQPSSTQEVATETVEQNSETPKVAVMPESLAQKATETKEQKNETSIELNDADAKPLASLVFKTPSFLLAIEQTWNQINLSKAEQVFINDMLTALNQDVSDAFQSADSFQWPPTDNEMFLVEDSMLAFSEYFSDFPHHLFIIFGDNLHKVLDEQGESWNISEIADIHVMNLPPLSDFIGNTAFKKRLWKNFLAPLAPQFK